MYYLFPHTFLVLTQELKTFQDPWRLFICQQELVRNMNNNVCVLVTYY